MLDAIPDLMFRIGKDGTFLDFVSAKGMETLLPPSEFIGKRMEDVLPPEVAEPSAEHHARAQRTGEIQIFEYQLLLNGEPHHFEARIAPCGADQTLSIIRDITERMRARLSNACVKTSLGEVSATASLGVAGWTPEDCADTKTTSKVAG